MEGRLNTQERQMTVQFKITNYDLAQLSKIADRYLDKFPGKKLDVLMDLEACVANGNPLRLDELLAASDFNFFHDVCGIRQHLDRDTGKLQDFFSPRYSL